MASPGQKRGAYGDLMAGFDSYTSCARCLDKGQGSNLCVLKVDCSFCNILTTDQLTLLATLFYKIKKEKRELKSGKAERRESDDISSALVDLALVSVVWVVNNQKTVKSTGKSVTKDKSKKKTALPNKACQVFCQQQTSQFFC